MTKTDPKKKLNKIEQAKAKKHPLLLKQELEEFAKIGWEAMDEFERDYGLKWLGFFYRPVTPGKFMLRMRVPNGILTSTQMCVLAEIIQRYCHGAGFQEQGNADITTRQNLQLRGMRIEDIPDIFERLLKAGLTSVQSGMDNVRNITGSPVAGIDGNELIDTRGLVRNLQDTITNNGEGNMGLSNLPRKFNIAVAGGRDNSVHAEINDLGYLPAYKNGKLGFNIIVGGYFAPKQYVTAIPLDAWIPPEDVVPLAKIMLTIYNENGPRASRTKCRLMHLIKSEDWGRERFRDEVEKKLGHPLESAAAKDEIDWEKRDHIGVYPQKQPGLNYVGLHVPVGRLYAEEMFELARMAEVYGGGEIRLTVEQNLIIPYIPDSRLEAFFNEPLVKKRLTINPEKLNRALVSCTGSEFCGYAIIETKNRALAMIKELESELEMPKPVRIHWTGCPNSCGQPQVADIGLIGTKTKKDGEVVEAVDIWMGGKVGKDACLGEEVRKRVPCDELKNMLRNLLLEHFEAKPKQKEMVTV
ncbi:ferredoxin--nitrite reductase [Oscillatoria salina]|uniref:ferredoxin--nitrite reductase n=1 Tax=Oscillatoria salina TaxID=331517 RepID=UPI0013B5C3C3|nr:ferredoxin--nitrite reductase [Oscillatoria salina]MBZ8182011.1 ferredoxin--nitrite reductase [Oscillatoria salina IIICB1]NET91485.1 ferredoxin--nitrite reductase [Kamptonema sp. SIO1D9]